ncbi:MAG TPA: sigma-70 family RNA polymerase sigma factor, partial [Streptosporangiaceae bacterium]
GEEPVPDVSVLFRQHHGGLVRLAVLLVGDQPTAEDVVQDVFTRLHAKGSRWRPQGDPLAYIRAGVVNGCRSAQRRRAVARRFGSSRDLQPVSSTEHSAEHEAIRSEDRRQVLAALAALPRRRQEVLVLRYYLGLSEAEIAEVLQITPGTVKSTAARGLAALASALREET